MSRIINQLATLITLVPDPAYGNRPCRICWQDRLGQLHEVLAVAVQDCWRETGTWWEKPGPLLECRCWRLMLHRGGLITLIEDLSRRSGDPQQWVVDRIED